MQPWPAGALPRLGGASGSNNGQLATGDTAHVLTAGPVPSKKTWTWRPRLHSA